MAAAGSWERAVRGADGDGARLATRDDAAERATRDRVLQSRAARAMSLVKFQAADGKQLNLQQVIFNNFFAPWASPVNASLAYAVCFVLLWLGLMALLLFYAKLDWVAIGNVEVETREAGGSIAAFSSRGLVLDGGLKPSLAAPGVSVPTSEPGRGDDGDVRFGTISGR